MIYATFSTRAPIRPRLGADLNLKLGQNENRGWRSPWKRQPPHCDGFLAYFTTKFTSLPGTTMTLATDFPTVRFWTFSSARAAASIVF